MHGASGALAALLCTVGLTLLWSGLWSGQALAQLTGRDLPTNSYITPFPEGDIYRLHVIGDTLSEGLHNALKSILSDDARVRVAAQHTAMSTLRNSGWGDLIVDFENNRPPPPAHVAVVMFGIYERGSVRRPGRSNLGYGSDEWAEEYSIRVERVMRALKSRAIAVYWVGLPVMRGSNSTEHARLMNQIVRETALRNGVKFISIFESFSDESGNYTDYGPDMEGKVRSLRWRDGIHFTSVGYEKIAHFVKRELQRDLRVARAERMVELRGAPAEMERIRPKAEEPKQPARSWTSLITGETQPAEASNPDGSLGLEGETVTVKLPIETGAANDARGELEFKIVRPRVAPSIVALVTRRSSPDRAVLFGEQIDVSSPSGKPVLGTVSPASARGITVIQNTTAPTQMPFFKVWAKGERLPPRQNRADDVTWPQPQPVVLIDPPQPDAQERVFEVSPVGRPIVSGSALPNWDGPPLPAPNPVR